ncbi:hypothetical protein, partial [uncultured Kocuria sp.]|uniref:2-oxoglutarate dehydrogenase E1 subunit family protein n=1 Tax=uncultured Kocuria sp. TaxID=259305 RepID=UPI0034597B8D
MPGAVRERTVTGGTRPAALLDWKVGTALRARSHCRSATAGKLRGSHQRATRTSSPPGTHSTYGRGVSLVPEQPQHLIPEEFAGNEWLVDELFEKYQADKNSVDKKWWPIFEQMDGG